MKKLIALALCLIMVLTMVACVNNETPEVTTENPSTPTEGADQTTAGAPEQTTEAAEQTTEEAPEQTTEEQTTEAEETTASIEFGDLPAAEQSALLAAMPATLPDGSSYEIACRTMSFDRGQDDYIISGNSSGSVSYVDVQGGAIFGQAIKMAAKADSKDSRAEIEVTPLGDLNIEGTRGIMFYVDFSNVQLGAEPGKMCSSVTINTNDIRSNGPDNTAGSGIGYYYDGATWVQTTNITSCRMQIPDNFAGWIYVPSSSYYDKTVGAALGETFPDILAVSMRCYTDGYTYSATDYIIFDEITFIK